MRINVKIDASLLKARTPREIKRLAFSTSQALNATVLAVQKDERVNLDRKYQIRKAGFMYRLVKITAFASPRKAQAFAEIAIDPTKKRVLLPLLETGEEKKSEVGKSVAVPITGSKARPSFSQPVPTRLTFLKLDFRRHVTAGGKVQWKGEKRTFLIPKVGVFQRGKRVKTKDRRRSAFAVRDRKGRFRGAVRERTKAELLYSFQQRVPMKATLQFTEIAEDTFDREFQRRFDRAFNSKKGG